MNKNLVSEIYRKNGVLYINKDIFIATVLVGYGCLGQCFLCTSNVFAESEDVLGYQVIHVINDNNGVYEINRKKNEFICELCYKKLNILAR